MINLMEIAERLEGAYANHKTLSRFTRAYPEFSLKQGYEVQRMLTEKFVSQGRKISGFKMGLTSLAKQRDVGVSEPICGVLFSHMEIFVSEGIAVKDFIHPRVEPEIVFVIGKEVSPDIRDIEPLLDCVSKIVLGVEVIDSRYENYDFKLPDVVADNTSASGYILGRENLLTRFQDIAWMGVAMKNNGEIVQTGTPAAVLGNPALAVLSLVKNLACHRRTLQPGMVVFTGGMTASVPVVKGDQVEVSSSFETISFGAK